MAVPPGLAIVQNPQPALTRRPLWGRSIAALALVFVFAAFTNAALMVAPISSWRDLVTTRLHLNSTLPVNSAITLFTLVVAPIVLVCGSVLAGRTVAGIGAPKRELIRRFSFALVPLGACMWAAHFLFHFFIGWSSAWPVFQRILGNLGLAVANQPALLGSNPAFSIGNIRIVQTVLLDIGLLATLYLGWRIARAYAPQMRLALRAIAPWSAVAVALYLFGIWTCLQPMQMRGLSGVAVGVSPAVEGGILTPGSTEPICKRDGLRRTSMPSGETPGSTAAETPPLRGDTVKMHSLASA